MAKPSSRKRKGARLGQHFLRGKWAARRLADAAGIREEECILEIGPGKGALTRELLKRGRVVAIEKDEALVQFLREEFADEIASGQLRIVQDDVRNVSAELLDIGPYVVAANIPYYITGEIIRQFLSATVQPRAMALLIQKEVAERIIARDKKESILSLSVQAYGAPRMVAKVSRGNFAPPPQVDSAILLIDDISRNRFGDMRENDFFALVHAGFASKRKKLAGNLARVYGPRSREALAACKLSPDVRAEDVALAEWMCLASALR